MPYKDKEKQKEAQRRYEEKRKGTRHRGWVWVQYPDSVDENWLEMLENEGVPVYISPLHDRDENADGTPKKPHNHALLLWSSPNTYENARAIADAIGGVMPPKNPAPGKPKPWAQDVRAAARYLCHLDNPDKAQYDPNDVKCINCTLSDYFELIENSADDDETLDEIFDFIDANSIVSFAAFVRYCRSERPEWRRLVYHKYAAVITRYIKSAAWEESVNRSATVQELKEQFQTEAENYVLNTLEQAFDRMRNADDHPDTSDTDVPICDWCGKPAAGGSFGPDGMILWCEEHEEMGRRLSEDMPDNL